MADNISESELINGCKKHKLKYQELLYKSFYSYAMSICLRYSYSKESAVEILNDSFFKVFENIKTFDENQPFKPWLRKIIINTAIDYNRKNVKFKNNIDLSHIDLQPIEPDAIDNLNINDILTMLNQLPEIYRLTFNLYEIEGYSHDEIAKLLDIAESTSRSNLTRAKKMLRQAFLNRN